MSTNKSTSNPMRTAMTHFVNDAKSHGLTETQARASLFANPAMRKLFFVLVSLIAAGAIAVNLP